MNKQTTQGVVVLVMIAVIIGGSLIFGMKFWGWIMLAGLLSISGWVLWWIWTLLSGATRWARRQ